MNSDKLKAALQEFYANNEDIGVTVYAILKGGEDETPKKLDIEADSLNGIKDLFINSLKENISDREDLSVLKLSTSDERLDAIYLYDVDLPDELLSLEAVLETDDLPKLRIDECELSTIKSLLIEIGNNDRQLVIYKTMASVNIFGRSSFFLKKSKTRLEKINDEFLRISSGFQLVRIAGELLVLDLNVIEKSFGFHEIIAKEAALGIESIQEMKIIQNPEVLHELLGDVRYARRFTKVAKASPVLKAGIKNESIISFCKTFPHLKGKIRFNDSEDQIILDTKVSKDLFIKLLMDDFLTSQLTSYHYESVAKDTVEEIEAIEG